MCSAVYQVQLQSGGATIDSSIRPIRPQLGRSCRKVHSHMGRSTKRFHLDPDWITRDKCDDKKNSTEVLSEFNRSDILTRGMIGTVLFLSLILRKEPFLKLTFLRQTHVGIISAVYALNLRGQQCDLDSGEYVEPRIVRHLSSFSSFP
jgi:hypothetical protein